MSTSECSNLVARAKPHVPVRPALYSPPMTDSDLAAAWAAVHDATPDGWYIGRPYDDEHHDRWEQNAFDQPETPVVGRREREWTAVRPTEVRGVREMARCLAEPREGRWPT